MRTLWVLCALLSLSAATYVFDPEFLLPDHVNKDAPSTPPPAAEAAHETAVQPPTAAAHQRESEAEEEVEVDEEGDDDGEGEGRWEEEEALWRAGRSLLGRGAGPGLAGLAHHLLALERSALPPAAHAHPNDGDEFDFVIVGGGAAGCALANRLSEVPHWRVLLLEAGGEEAPIMDVPFLLGAFHDTDVNWRYRTVPQKHMCTRLRHHSCDYPQGRALGGSTVINFMLNIRGNARDYDAWAAAGNEGWDFESLLPYFRKVERMQIPELSDSPFHGAHGHIRVNYSPYHSDMSKALIRAYEEWGAEQVDYNGATQAGVSRTQTTTARGVRWSAARGYLRPARGRPNLWVRTRSTATRLLFDDEDAARVVGVQYVHHGELREARATKEVIVTAGAINSAKLLMLSGIGPRGLLESLDIPVVCDLLVGYNLQDHVAFPVHLVLKHNESVAPTALDILTDARTYTSFLAARSGPLTTPGGLETVFFSELPHTHFHAPDWPAVEVLHQSFASLALPMVARHMGVRHRDYQRMLRPLLRRAAWTATVVPLRPRSRGRVWLRSADPRAPPCIDPRGLAHPRDRYEMLAGIKELLTLLETHTMWELGANLYRRRYPGCEHYEFASDDYWLCSMRGYAVAAYNPVGTVKMGPEDDPYAVVSSVDLRVRGVAGLRVADASVIPTIISGHTLMATYVIAEKAADIIKAEYEEYSYIHEEDSCDDATPSHGPDHESEEPSHQHETTEHSHVNHHETEKPSHGHYHESQKPSHGYHHETTEHNHVNHHETEKPAHGHYHESQKPSHGYHHETTEHNHVNHHETEKPAHGHYHESQKPSHGYHHETTEHNHVNHHETEKPAHGHYHESQKPSHEYHHETTEHNHVNHHETEKPAHGHYHESQKPSHGYHHETTEHNHVNHHETEKPAHGHYHESQKPSHGYHHETTEHNHVNHHETEKPAHGHYHESQKPSHGYHHETTEHNHVNNHETEKPSHGHYHESQKPSHGYHHETTEHNHVNNHETEKPSHGHYHESQKPSHGYHHETTEHNHVNHHETEKPAHGHYHESQKPSHGYHHETTQHNHVNHHETEKPSYGHYHGTKKPSHSHHHVTKKPLHTYHNVPDYSEKPSHTHDHSKKPSHIHDHSKKPSHTHDHSKKPSHTHDHSEKPSHIHDHSEKPSLIHDHSEKPSHTHDHSEKPSHTHDHSEKPSHTHDHSEKPSHTHGHSEKPSHEHLSEPEELSPVELQDIDETTNVQHQVTKRPSSDDPSEHIHHHETEQSKPTHDSEQTMPTHEFEKPSSPHQYEVTEPSYDYDHDEVKPSHSYDLKPSHNQHHKVPKPTTSYHKKVAKPTYSHHPKPSHDSHHGEISHLPSEINPSFTEIPDYEEVINPLNNDYVELVRPTNYQPTQNYQAVIVPPHSDYANENVELLPTLSDESAHSLHQEVVKPTHGEYLEIVETRNDNTEIEKSLVR